MTERESALEDLLRLQEGAKVILDLMNKQSISLQHKREVMVMKELLDAVLSNLDGPIAYLKKPEEKPIIIKESIYNRRRL